MLTLEDRVTMLKTNLIKETQALSYLISMGACQVKFQKHYNNLI